LALKGIWAVLGTIIILGVITLYSLADFSETNNATNFIEKTVVPQTRTITPQQETAQAIQTEIIPKNKFFDKTNTESKNLLPEADAISSTATTVTLTEWQVKSGNVQLHGIAIDSSGNIFYGSNGGSISGTDSNANTIGRLNPSTNQNTEWTRTLDNNARTRQLVVDSSNNVYFTDLGLDQIVRLNPTTGVFTSWQLSSGVGPFYIANDTSGNIFFTELDGNVIGKLNPSTNEVTEWTIPTINSKPTYIAIDSTNIVFFIENTGNKIGRLNTSTNSFTEWSSISNIPIHGLAFDSSNNVYFGPNGKLGKLDPSTNDLTEWTLSGFQGGPLTIDSAEILYKGTSVEISRFVQSTNTETVWALPSCGSNCGLNGILVDSSDNVFFTEQDGEIGRLTESP